MFSSVLKLPYSHTVLYLYYILYLSTLYIYFNVSIKTYFKLTNAILP